MCYRCFELFSLFHELTDSPEAIYLATCDVIKEFYEDNVLYLELRTTPKASFAGHMTQKSYVEVVVKAIEDTCSTVCQKMTVKLLLSIDRKRSVTDAEETMKIAEEYTTSTTKIVGVDLSGNPVCDARHLFPVLEYVKKAGLNLTVHISEVPNTFEEVEALLKIHPDRLGHGTYLHPSKGGSEKNYDLLKQLKIPLEVCLTSNVISKTVESYESHHFPLFRDIGYPIVLCTDDKGVFDTTLSKEYYLASKYYGLMEDDLFNHSFNSINYIFATEQEKCQLQELWKQQNNKNN
ncbi:adenosine deaminase-like protein isoform X2 [Uloborus diversus]|uniref:adenosine deaminase-like protein isoform X2 n=1 Tax=Uloborus diversus TaxID=327109 RepID=UPI00240A3DBA|nr:adenosine deaminase-like protein isoform X2 [Uloborus diversus]